MSTGRKRRVIEGNTVRKLQVREERHYRRQEESHAYRVERDQKIQYTTVIYMLFLTIAAAMVLWSCVTYLQLQAETTSRVKNIAALETELEEVLLQLTELCRQLLSRQFSDLRCLHHASPPFFSRATNLVLQGSL